MPERQFLEVRGLQTVVLDFFGERLASFSHDVIAVLTPHGGLNRGQVLRNAAIPALVNVKGLRAIADHLIIAPWIVLLHVPTKAPHK